MMHKTCSALTEKNYQCDVRFKLITRERILAPYAHSKMFLKIYTIGIKISAMYEYYQDRYKGVKSAEQN